MAAPPFSSPHILASWPITLESGAVFIHFLAGTGKGVLRPAKSSWPQAFSPFSAPELQDAEVPYESLPVDKGHLLPMIRPYSGVSTPGVYSLQSSFHTAGSLPSNGPGSLKSRHGSSKNQHPSQHSVRTASGNAVNPADQPTSRKVTWGILELLFCRMSAVDCRMPDLLKPQNRQKQYLLTLGYFNRYPVDSAMHDL